MAKTDWTMLDDVKPSDMNQIGTEINDLREDIDNLPVASTTVAGIAKLNNATTSTSQTDAATPKAVNDARQAAVTAAATDATTKATTAENNARGASLPRAGGALSGRVDFQTWGSFSADAGGGVLYGSNCYLDPSGSPRTFRYTNTHANLGARGIYMQFPSGSTSMEIYEFDTGNIAATAGAAFTPTLKRIINADDVILPNDNPTTNLLWNSTGLFGLDGWTNVGGYPILASTSPDVTALFYTNDAVPSGQYAVLDSAVINVYSGTQYDLQAMFFSSGSPSNAVIQIEVKNESTGATLFTLAADPQKWWHRKKMTLTMPPLVSQIRIRLVVSNAPAGQTKGFARIRFNLRNVTNKDVPYDFTGDLTQLANDMKTVKTSGVDAKQGVVNAINAKGGSASMSDTWAQLAAKINAIQTGNLSPGSRIVLGPVGSSTTSTSQTLFKGIKFNKPGTYRVFYNFGPFETGTTPVYTRILIDGVEFMPTVSATSVTSISRDIPVQANQEIQIYYWVANSANRAQISSFTVGIDLVVTER